jgi:hypothetical protein
MANGKQRTRVNAWSLARCRLYKALAIEQATGDFDRVGRRVHR